MKINNKKIIVSTLALAMGAALAGSISGSVAWYQYSTRASAQIAGSAAGTARNLYVKSAQATSTSYLQHISFAAQNFRPVSYYDNAGAAEFYEHPVYKYAEQEKVDENDKTIEGVKTVAYAEYSLYFKVEDKVNSATPKQIAKDVYLSGFSLTHTGSGSDVTPAVRIRIDGANDFIIASAADTTVTHGQLDLNGLGGNDKDGILVDDSDGNEITYYAGADDSEYDSVLASSAMPTMTNAYAFTDNANKALTTTKTSGDSDVVKVQIWLEGWQKLGASGSESALWDDGYFAQNFTINMQFACEADLA